MIVISIDKDK